MDNTLENLLKQDSEFSEAKFKSKVENTFVQIKLSMVTGKTEKINHFVNEETNKKIVKKEKNIYTEDMMYSYGDKVMHDKFGLGVVVGINKDLLSIAFSKEIGIKQFLKNHKSIKKVD